MPSWPIHVALANRLKRKYNFTDDFIIGNVLPDATNGFIIKDISNIAGHTETHFNYQGPNRPPKSDIQKFLELYQDSLNNPIVLGYLIHLITDNYFNEYTIKNHVQFIEGKRFAILNDGSITDSITPMKLKHEDFGTFGNYLISNNELGDEINETEETRSLISDLLYPLTGNDIDIIIDKVNSFIMRDVSKSHNYKMFTEEELINLFDECYKYLEEVVENYLENKKILVKRKED